MEGGRTERPYTAGDKTEWPIRLKTSASLSASALTEFADVPVRSVWLTGSGHSARDIAAVVDAFAELADVFVAATTTLDDEAIRALIPCGQTLRRFGVMRSRITDDGARVLASMPELLEVRLEHSQLTDNGVAALASCRNLQMLVIDGNRGVRGNGFRAFVDHPSLRSLFVRGTGVNDDAIGHLNGCVSLRDIYLSSTNVTERCLLTLPQNPDLKVSLPQGLDQERVDKIRCALNFVVDGVDPNSVVELPQAADGTPVDLPPQMRSNALTFAVFSSSSCAPCAWLKATFNHIRPNLREQFKYVELDVEEHLKLASALRVRSVPAVFVMQFGIELDRFVGAMGAHSLEERLERVLSL